MYEIFGDIPEVQIYIDDLFEAGETEGDHGRALKTIFDRALKYNIKFNEAMTQFEMDSVEFIGKIFSKDGIRNNQCYIEVISEMPVPDNKKDVLRFSGMVKYFCKFIPNLSQISAPLRKLTYNNVDWQWNKTHRKSFVCLK